MKINNSMLIIISSLLSLIFGLTIIRVYIPELLGGSSTITVIQSSKVATPFYKNLLIELQEPNKNFLISDSKVLERAAPLFPDQGLRGPHDILGFRNYFVPNKVNTVMIGDSQTYGNNAVLKETWPYVFQKLTNQSVYSMATGGWGAVQYRYIFKKALSLSPKRIIVAFYTGNDAMDSFYAGYGMEVWSEYREGSSLTIDDLPPVIYPPRKKDIFVAKFKNGKKVFFTPLLRLSSNESNPAINAGYKIIENVAKQMAFISKEKEIKLFFIIIPTKEYAYSALLNKENIVVSDVFERLIMLEKERISSLSEYLSNLSGAKYIDVTVGIQSAVTRGERIYPEGSDGHMLVAGYKLIAEQLAQSL